MRRGKDNGKVDASDYFSDESDFYGTPGINPHQVTRLTKIGDEDVKQDLEDRAQNFNPAEWWAKDEPSLTEMANSNMAKSTKKKDSILYNPYEGVFCARQLTETVDEFLVRLPPATTSTTATTQWIYIANPYRKATWKSENNQVEFKEEAPLEEDSNWSTFVPIAQKMLEDLTDMREMIERKRAGEQKASILRAVNKEKNLIVEKILDAAVEHHCTSGKVSSAFHLATLLTDSIYSGLYSFKWRKSTKYGL